MTSEGFCLTGAEGGVYFGLWADGVVRKILWTAASCQNGWQAFDRDEDGVTDNGAELFGWATPQPSLRDGEMPIGFRAPAVYDRPDDGGN
jgi:hypothetical protein